MVRDIINYFKQGGMPFIILCVALLICNRGGYITLIGLFVISVFIGVCLKQKLDLIGAGLIFYSVFYILISSLNGFRYSIPTVFLYGCAPYFFYSFGRAVPYKWPVEDKLIVFWLIVIFCYCLDIFYVTANHIVSTGEFINVRRDFSFDADGNMEMAATLVGLAMDIGMVGLPVFIISRNKKYRFPFLVLTILSLLVTLHLLNRTGLVVLLLCFVGMIGWRARKKPMQLISALFVILFLFLILKFTGVLSDELLSYYDSRNEDLSSMGSRSDRWSFALSQLLVKPFGWAENGEVYNVHNMWLDIARISGIIPFLLLVIFTSSGFIQVLKYIKRTESTLSYLLLGLSICFFASCFVEPIYGGTHFLLYCMLWGVQSTLDKQSYRLVE